MAASLPMSCRYWTEITQDCMPRQIHELIGHVRKRRGSGCAAAALQADLVKSPYGRARKRALEYLDRYATGGTFTISGTFQ